MDQIYLDWAATALPDRDLLDEALRISTQTFANPSSPHQSGKDASALMAKLRADTAACFGAAPGNIFFTSGGTESNNMAAFSLLNRKRKGNIIISGIEHPSMWEPAMTLQKFGWEIRTVNPDDCGIIAPEKIADRIDEDSRAVFLIMVNNETGAVQPAEEIGKLIRRRESGGGIHFHIDAVQAACKIQLNLKKLGVDSASISSHKFSGPRGAGLLYLSRPAEMLYGGGGQERGIRHGTENTFGIAGTALAAAKYTETLSENSARALEYKKVLVERISKIRGVRFLPDCGADKLLDPSLFSPYILSVSLKPVPGEVMVRVLSDKGFDVGSGSACSTGKKKKSRVMEAMGVNADDAYSAIRISTGPATKIEEIYRFCDTLEKESTILINTLGR